MKKMILFTMLLFIFLSSCSGSSKMEKKDNKKQVKSQQENEESKSADENEKKQEEGKVNEPSKEQKNEKISIISDEAEKKDKSEDKELEDKKESNEFTEKDKIKINEEIMSFLNLSSKQKLDKVNNLLNTYPQSDILYFYKAKAYYDLGDNDNSLFNIERSLKLNPKNTYSLSLRFKILFKQDSKKAEEMLFSY